MNAFLFGLLPYITAGVAVAGLLWRFGAARHTVTTESSQLLESRLLAWGSVAWHYAILVVLLVHLVAMVFPRAVVSAMASPTRLLVIEAIGLAFGLTALCGLLVLAVRRFRLRAGKRGLDWLVLAALLVQVVSGVLVAATARWGLAWFPHVATPWLASLARLAPRVDFLASLPLAVKVHLAGAFVLLALLPWTRLAHMLVAPVGYLWRLPQIVVWRRKPASAR